MSTNVPPEVESLVANAPVSAHLATAVDDRPHVAPVWYGYRDGVIYFMTGGKKLANVRRNPRVALSIEEAVGGDVSWNVTLLGTATVRDDQERIDWASEWVYDRYDDDPEGDGSDESEAFTDESDEATPDGGESDASESGYALVEVEIGSVSWNVYG